jgi:hypothetical protein
MMTRKHLLLSLLSTLLVFNLGCFGSDDAPTGPEIPDFENLAVQDLATEGAILSQAIIDVASDLASGAMGGGKDITDPYWDPSCNCWRWYEGEGDYEDPLVNWERGMSFATTFYNGDTPQMEFEGADKIAVDLFYNFWESQFDAKYSSKSVTFNLSLEVTDWAMGVATITGDGTGEVSGGRSIGEEDWEGYYEEFNITETMTMPFQGCPGGTMTMANEEASFIITFTGGTTANWAFQAGPASDSGSFPLDCGSR